MNSWKKPTCLRRERGAGHVLGARSRASQASQKQPRRAATLVVLTVLLPVALILAGFAINISYVQYIQTDAQIAADAAVSAAGRTYAVTGDKDAAILAAQEIANRNPVGGKVLPLDARDFEFGISTCSGANETYVFEATGEGNAVRLTTHSLSNAIGGEIDPVFPLFGGNIQIRPLRSATCTQIELDIALVIDRSGSMAYSSSEISAYPPAPANAPSGWEFGDPVPMQARWLDAIAAVQVFIAELEGSPQKEFMSLSLYNHMVSTPQYLTNDYSVIVDHLTTISGNFIAGGTNIGDGILEGIGALADPLHRRPFATPVVIILTDGVHNYGTHPMSAAYTAKYQGVVVFTVTFSDEAEQSLMGSVAGVTGGRHYHAEDVDQLKKAFQEIAGRLPTLITR